MKKPVLKLILIAALGIFSLSSFSGIASALSGEALEIRVREISDGLRCPTCQAISVNDSEAAFSTQIKDKVRRMLQEGQNEEEIKAYFVSRYGEWILRAPKKEGLGLVLWFLPIGLIVLVGALIIYHTRNSTRRHQDTVQNTKSSKLSETQRKKISDDLKRFEEEN